MFSGLPIMAWKDVAVRLIVLGFIVLLALGAFSAIGLGEEAGPGDAEPPLMLALARPASVILDNGNLFAVESRPSRTTVFRLQRRTRITLITTYHWNDGRGARPGSIVLIDGDGEVYGPWRAKGSPGQGGVPDAYWTVEPDITLSSGRYTVIDSDFATRSQNAESGDAGIASVEGRPR